jgi:hypothetical protein
MMIVPGVTLIALAVLFLLTSLALQACDRLPHPLVTVVALVATLVLGLAFAMS